MIVHAVALTNIKSYDSLEVALHAGVNFIAGRNGAGKTTLIEAIGYALFGYAPVRAADYFLRKGEKQGEMRVTFSHGGEKYTVVRKLGKADTAAVFDEAGNELDLHGVEDVRAFIRTALGMPPFEDMGRLFANVIGIPQGTFTAPFLEIESERKKIFDRILRVEDYRQASDALRAFMREFILGKETALAGRLEGLSVQTQGFAQRMEAEQEARSGLLLMEAELEIVQASANAAQAAYAQWQDKEKRFRACEQQEALCWQRAAAAQAACKTAGDALGEALQAASRVRDSQAAHDAYIEAESALQKLETQRQARAALDMRKLTLQSAKEKLGKGLEDWQGKIDQMLAWEAALAAMPKARADAAALEKAERKCIEARETLALARKALEEEQRVREALRDNRCPYHEQECLQQASVMAHAGERLITLEARFAKAQADVNEAQQQVCLLQDSRGKLQVLEKIRQDHRALQDGLTKFALAAERCAKEAAGALENDELLHVWAQSAKDFVDAQAVLRAMQTGMLQLQAQMQAYAGVETHLEAARAQRKANEAQYITHIRQGAIAALADARREALEAQQAVALEAQQALEEASRLKAGAEDAFDAQACEAARQKMLESRDALSTSRAQKQERAREAARLAEEVSALLELQSQQRQTEQALAEVRAAADYAKDAAEALREMGEYMAGRYREQLGAKAQGWYRQISGEAAALHWAGDYDLQLTDAFEGTARTRGFRQLSGGEQMTAALAIRMALLQAFSVAGFACFDEPTTGLDVFRREQLAAALAQVTSVFDQAIIVSHDDTFDALSENVICLTRDHLGATTLSMEN